LGGSLSVRLGSFPGFKIGITVTSVHPVGKSPVFLNKTNWKYLSFISTTKFEDCNFSTIKTMSNSNFFQNELGFGEEMFKSMMQSLYQTIFRIHKTSSSTIPVYSQSYKMLVLA
jgi:hypothetical protein